MGEFADGHYGLISRDAARAAGVSDSAWYRAVRAGAVERISERVVRMWGSESTFHQRALAAIWTAGHGAMASHRTAARLWGVSRPESDPIDVLVIASVGSRRRDGVVHHRQRDLKNTSPITFGAIPATRVTRTLVDLGSVDRWSVLDAMSTLLTTGAVNVAQLNDAVGRHSRQGRHGVVALREAIAVWGDQHVPPDSVLETRMMKVLKEAGLARAEFHASVAGFEVDFLLRSERVVIECDGWASHGLCHDQFEFDRRRDAVLLAAGYVVVHVTWHELVRSPRLVVRRLRAVLRAQRVHRSA